MDGEVEVSIRQGDGQENAAPGGFDYLGMPTVTGISESAGAAGGEG